MCRKSSVPLENWISLEELLQDDSVTEIMVNGYQKIFYEKAGRLYTWDKQFAGREKLEDVIQKMVGKE